MRRKLKADRELSKTTYKYDKLRMKHEVGRVKEYLDSVSVIPHRNEGHVTFIVRTLEEENQYCLDPVTVGGIEAAIKR